MDILAKKLMKIAAAVESFSTKKFMRVAFSDNIKKPESWKKLIPVINGYTDKYPQYDYDNSDDWDAFLKFTDALETCNIRLNGLYNGIHGKSLGEWKQEGAYRLRQLGERIENVDMRILDLEEDADNILVLGGLPGAGEGEFKRIVGKPIETLLDGWSSWCSELFDYIDKVFHYIKEDENNEDDDDPPDAWDEAEREDMTEEVDYSDWNQPNEY